MNQVAGLSYSIWWIAKLIFAIFVLALLFLIFVDSVTINLLSQLGTHLFDRAAGAIHAT